MNIHSSLPTPNFSPFRTCDGSAIHSPRRVMLLPLPKGEGRGEGEGDNQSHRNAPPAQPRPVVSESPIRNPQSAIRNSAFTLIELLVVIAIIGLLASLIVGGAGIATTKMRRARVEAERDALITAIESYQKSKGYFPPDNTNTTAAYSTYQNSLYYELTGMILTNIGGQSVFLAVDQEQFPTVPVTVIPSYFSVGGFMNVPTAETPSVNFYKSMKANQHTLVNAVGSTGGPGTYTVMGIGVPGPVQLNPATTGLYINPWHYVVSNPTNNTTSFDLWMDVSWAGKTNRVSNWSKDPQVVAY